MAKLLKNEKLRLFFVFFFSKVWNVFQKPLYLHRVFHSIRFKVNIWDSAESRFFFQELFTKMICNMKKIMIMMAIAIVASWGSVNTAKAQDVITDPVQQEAAIKAQKDAQKAALKQQKAIEKQEKAKKKAEKEAKKKEREAKKHNDAVKKANNAQKAAEKAQEKAQKAAEKAAAAPGDLKKQAAAEKAQAAATKARLKAEKLAKKVK